ncbi:MAG: ribosome maturation factor RimM [Alicyclobacillus sp.]|nr:ribosome maturation factor RimM [Alicyclobacillus sp.]
MFTVGVIVGTHGLRGEVRVISKTDFPERRFRRGQRLRTRPAVGEDGWLTVQTARRHKQFWLVAFSGYDRIDMVEKWRGVELCVAEADLMPLPAYTYYIHQLVGLRVVADDGREVGVLTDVLQPGANDVYVVRGPLQADEVLIPAIADCVLDVSLETGVMTVHLLPGLLKEDELEANKPGSGGDSDAGGGST